MSGRSITPHVGVPRVVVLMLAIAAEVALALTMQELRILGLVHAVGLFLFGLYAVLKQDLALLICALAYLAGSEVLWRQVRAPVFYLVAPYTLTILSLFAVVFVLKNVGRDGRLAILYAALLLPATINTVRTAGGGARELVAFALSGPIALAAFVAFTSQVKVRPWLYRRILWITVISTVGPMTIAVNDIRNALADQGSISFSSQSNTLTSGGFGPVQVSSALSLGIMAAVLLIISERDRMVRILAGVIAAVLMVQTLLTFSRGGSFSVAIAVTVLAVVQSRNPRVRNRIIGLAAVTLALGYFLVFPWLESFTGGEFEGRFSDTQSARTELAANDTAIFRENIVLGVGPGMTKYQRLTYRICQLRNDKCRNEASSHTEYTRMLSEHGIPGVVSLVLLIMLALRAFRRAGPGRAFTIAWMTWAIAQMFYANLRIVAVPYAFGLAFLTLSGDERSTDPPSSLPGGPAGARIPHAPVDDRTRVDDTSSPSSPRGDVLGVNALAPPPVPSIRPTSPTAPNAVVSPDAVLPPPYRGPRGPRPDDRNEPDR